MEDAHQKILAACSSGNISALESLFQELNISSDHPKSVYVLDRSLPEEQQLPVVERMLLKACASQQVETLPFLCAKFPGASFYGSPMRAAIDTGNAKLLEVICKLEPQMVNSDMGDDECYNTLGYACSRANGAELVKVLLKAGADPNEEPPHRMPACLNVAAAVIGGVPTSTFEQFFDAGYNGHEISAVYYAVKHKRQDVLQVLFARGGKLPWARFPPEEELLEAANENKDEEMAALIRRIYAARSQQEKGLLSRFVGKFRFKGGSDTGGK